MKIIISGIITGSIILNALVFPMTSVSAHNNDLVSSAVREGFYQEIYEDDGAITYDYFENNKRIVKTVKDEYTISFESDHTTGIAQIVENGSIIETIDMNTMRDDNLNWTIDPEDEKMLSQFMKKAAFNESQDIDLPNSLKAKYEVVIENNIPVVRPTKGEYINPQWKITAQAYPFTVNLSYLIGEAKRIYEYQIQTFGRCLGDS